MHKLKLAIAVVLLVPTSMNVYALKKSDIPAANAAEVSAAKRLNTLLSKANSLKANFMQTTTTAKKTPTGNKLKKLQASSMNKRFTGTMTMARPNRFRWETKTPAKQLIVANKKTLWIYDPDLEQATQQKVDKQMANTPALLLSGSQSKIMKNFKVTQPNRKKDVFVLHSKTDDVVFKTLAIAFIQGKPRSLVMHDALGQKTTIQFTSIKMNPKLSRSQFDFSPPAGVDVIYQ